MHPILRYLQAEDRPLAWLARRLKVSRSHLSTITRKGGGSPAFAEAVSRVTGGAVAAAEVIFWKPSRRISGPLAAASVSSAERSSKRRTRAVTRQQKRTARVG